MAVSILMTVMALLVPQMSRYRSVQQTNQCAQELASQLRQAQRLSIRTETPYKFTLWDAKTYALYKGNSATAYYAKDLQVDYGGVNATATGGTDIVFGENGWTNASTTISSASDARGTYYPISLSAGTTVYTVKVYTSGSVWVQ